MFNSVQNDCELFLSTTDDAPHNDKDGASSRDTAWGISRKADLFVPPPQYVRPELVVVRAVIARNSYTRNIPHLPGCVMMSKPLSMERKLGQRAKGSAILMQRSASRRKVLKAPVTIT
jgi:hypothetical protein